ncbi:hypothetical protein NQ314_009092 [Rhamnusium bicolor]|uniref:DUF659 domain-containing protein n=1 Tax=Rhamnusium bicolor TaxID=1586634 RepID=A0AAV8Y4L5_9CUCU|nr:hypothetical protein NQ314_009092 [Rhamnusium bicolor]
MKPIFHLPSRYDLSNTLLNEEYNRIKPEVELKIKEANHLLIQCDGWSNIRNEGIINFMITSPSPLFIKSVETRTEKHTSEYIASPLEEILLEYDVKKFLVLITNNAPNMRKATKMLETKYPHLVSFGCFAHTLHLLCQDILKSTSVANILIHTKKHNKEH